MNKKIIPILLTLLTLPIFANAQATSSYTQAQVATHNTSNDCWIIVSGKIYSVAAYVSMHPGGSGAITTFCGKDATTAFMTKGGRGSHSIFAQSTLGTFLVGNLSATPSTVTGTTTQVTTGTSTQVNASSTPEQLFTVCKQASIEKRDSAIVAARSIYTTSINRALTKRKEGEKAAVALTDVNAKKTALKKVTADYKKEVKAAQTTLTATRKGVLATSETEGKTCQKTRKEERGKIEEKKNEIKKEIENMKNEREEKSHSSKNKESKREEDDHN